MRRWIMAMVPVLALLTGCGAELWTSQYVTEDGTHQPSMSAMVSVRTDNSVYLSIGSIIATEGRLDGTTLYDRDGNAIGELVRGRTARLSVQQGKKTYGSVLVLSNTGAGPGPTLPTLGAPKR